MRSMRYHGPNGTIYKTVYDEAPLLTSDDIEAKVREAALAEALLKERCILEAKGGGNIKFSNHLLGRTEVIRISSWFRAPIKRAKLARARRRYRKENS